MDNDEYFNNLNKKANEEPYWEKEPPPPKPKKSFKSYSFGTYTGMERWVGLGVFIYLMGCFMLGLTIPVFHYSPDFSLLLPVVAGIGILYILIVCIGYLRFRGWQERLPFFLEGWNELVDIHPMNAQKYYRTVIVKVVPKSEESSVNLLHIRNAMKVLILKQNRWIQPDTFDNRSKWEHINHLMVQGSCNNAAMGRIKKCLENEFTEIAKRTGCIEKIEIRFNPKVFYMETTERFDELVAVLQFESSNVRRFTVRLFK